MRVIVTGGAGYVGSVLVGTLLTAGHEVRVLDAGIYGLDHLERYRENGRFTVGFADLMQAHAWTLTDIDAVIHLGGVSNDPTANFNPKATFEVNVKATDMLLMRCRFAGVRRFILASSASVYDTGEANHGSFASEERDETTEVNTEYMYSRSKIAAEDLLLNAGLPCPVILRKGTVFGWSPRMRWDLVVNAMVRSGLSDGRIRVIGSGLVSRPLLHVQDAAAAYLWALEAPEEAVKGQTFNVAGGNWSIGDVATYVQQAFKGFGRQVDVELVDSPTALRDYRVSTRKLEAAGFVRAYWGVRAGAAEIIREVRELPIRDLFHPRTENIAWVKTIEEVKGLLESHVTV